ncbi:hypothetical protein BD413DRAFT_606933 [Trametes elegans]|nr:hypothetical protein BD413DRAFT_606933 [Trametes elegans]
MSLSTAGLRACQITPIVRSRASPTSDKLGLVLRKGQSPLRRTWIYPKASEQSSSARPGPSAPRPPRRRIRPKIALDPSQPLTAQGKPRARVYVACNQCRARKTRCDGAKPICHHCRKRPPEDGGECSYEPQPNRRGQDKTPGTRVRGGAKRRRMSGGESCSADSDDGTSRGGRSSSTESSASPQVHGSYENLSDLLLDEFKSDYDPFAHAFNAVEELPSANVELDLGPHRHEFESIPERPSLQFTRETWWDAILTFYATEDGAPQVDAVSLSSERRSATMRDIVTDLRAFFHASLYWASFIHLPRFFDTVLNSTKRGSMQPSLMLAALAVGTLSQSSEVEKGPAGRARALRLLNMAHGALQASLASGWVDIGLVQASWLIAYFELQSHPLHSIERGRSSLLLLDSLIRLFSLTTLDADLLRAKSSSAGSSGIASASGAVPSNSGFIPAGATFPSIPGVTPSRTAFTPFMSQTHARHLHARTPPQTSPNIPDNITLGPSTSPLPAQCTCTEFTISHHWPSVHGLAPSWQGTLMWPTGLAEGDFQKEECRRLVWAAVMLTASLNSYTSVIEDIENHKLSIKDPRNFTILFPGEALALAGSPVLANNIWTLYMRAMLLLHSCVCTRGDPTLTEAERAQFAINAWLEIETMETALEQHTCGLERWFGFQAREMLFSARMCVSHEFQRYIPQVTTHGSKLFYRDKAESWLRHRMTAADRVWESLVNGHPEPTMDYRKPVLIYWFMSHIIKALVLWKADPTLMIALNASKSFARRAEHLMMFWPNPDQRREWQALRYQLVEACMKAGIPPPEVGLPVPIPRKNSTST